MLGFIELHDKAPTEKRRPFLLAVSAIYAVWPADEDCAAIHYSEGFEANYVLVQESYAEVVAKLEAFQQAIAAASRPQRPFIRTQRGKA